LLGRLLPGRGKMARITKRCRFCAGFFTGLHTLPFPRSRPAVPPPNP
jgi:hypothetical protein